MIFDTSLMFSDNQAITADAPSTNIVDLGDTGTPFGGRKLVADFGKGTKIPLVVNVDATFNTLTSLTVSLQGSATENFAAPQEIGSRTYPLAQLLAGTQLEFPECIMEGAKFRYLRLNYDVNGTNPTTGRITAAVVAARQTNFGGHY
jgi:hypothetical protein